MRKNSSYCCWCVQIEFGVQTPVYSTHTLVIQRSYHMWKYGCCAHVGVQIEFELLVCVQIAFCVQDDDGGKARVVVDVQTQFMCTLLLLQIEIGVRAHKLLVGVQC